MNKTLEDYLTLPYTIELVPDPDGGWFVAVKELPGCMSQGDTEEEALEMIRDAMEGWLAVALEDGMKIPEPRNLEDYSGKFVVRMPRSLHRELVERATEEETSLNQYINVLLAHAIGDRVPATPADDPFWPGLKHSVKHALRCAGMEGEAGALDERLFAKYVEDTLAQVEAALEGGYIRDATTDLERLDHVLSLAEERSPALSAFRHAVQLLQSQIEREVHLQRGLVEREQMLQSQIERSVQEASQMLVTKVSRESRVRYAHASMEPTTQQIPMTSSPVTSTTTEW
jgi:antitoxin HicB